MRTDNLESIRNTDVVIGDQLYVHGLVMEVTNKIVKDGVHANLCKCLTPDADSNMPKHWRDGWNQQGNHNAMVYRLKTRI